MMRLMQIAALGLLLSMAALCGFGCWGIYALVASERKIAVDSDAAIKAAAQTAAKVGAVADNVDGLISQTKPEIAETLRRANATIANLDKTAAGLNVAVAELNAPCVPGPCGTLADVNRTLGSVRLASGQVTAFSLHEQTQLDQVNAQETAIADAAQVDLTKLGGAIDGVNALATNKDLAGSLKQTNVALGAVAGMATDTEQYWQGVLHPKWTTRVWNAVTGVAIEAAKFFF